MLKCIASQAGLDKMTISLLGVQVVEGGNDALAFGLVQVGSARGQSGMCLG